MLKIENEGADIAYSNYWDSEYAKKGLYFLSWNAGVARLQIPDTGAAKVLREMKTAKYVILSRGIWGAANYCDGLEIMFEDHSDSPFAIHLSTSHLCGMIAEHRIDEFVFTVWGREGKLLQLLGKYRKVESLPCLDPWREQSIG